MRDIFDLVLIVFVGWSVWDSGHKKGYADGWRDAACYDPTRRREPTVADLARIERSSRMVAEAAAERVEDDERYALATAAEAERRRTDAPIPWRTRSWKRTIERWRARASCRR